MFACAQIMAGRFDNNISSVTSRFDWIIERYRHARDLWCPGTSDVFCYNHT